MRQHGICVELLQLGHSLFPHFRVKGHWDDSQVLQGPNHKVGMLQTRHGQLTLDLCVVFVRLLQAEGRYLETWAREGAEGQGHGSCL